MENAGAVSQQVRIGCPVWAHLPWVGRFFASGTRREAMLAQYSSVFGAVEGNATFYGLPAEATVARWAEEAPPTFRFAFKFPRTLSHDLALRGAPAQAETQVFLHRLAPVADRCGPCFLQLHARFGPRDLPTLADYLRSLPPTFTYAVEVRHPEFFAGGAAEADLDALLVAAGVDRVLFDTRALFAAEVDPHDKAAQDALRKKPRLPVRFTATGSRPFVRWVGDPRVEANDRWFGEWVEVISSWLDEGRQPWVFLHHPDDLHAPALGRRFQTLMHARRPDLVPAPPLWPAERGKKSPEPGQMDLFGAF